QHPPHHKRRYQRPTTDKQPPAPGPLQRPLLRPCRRRRGGGPLLQSHHVDPRRRGTT
ncbi:unnamed protein product, partial [Clonostachys rosea f. rosea IK726]